MTTIYDDTPTNFWGLVDQLRLPQKWLLQEIKAGRIPCLTVGKHRHLYKPSIVQAALGRRCTEFPTLRSCVVGDGAGI